MGPIFPVPPAPPARQTRQALHPAQPSIPQFANISAIAGGGGVSPSDTQTRSHRLANNRGLRSERTPGWYGGIWASSGLVCETWSATSTAGGTMSKTGRKRRARRKNKANHGKRPNT